MSDSAVAQWVSAVPIERLRAAGRAVTKIGSRQIALFAVGDRVYACNNRCPHEGYPLVEGDVVDAARCRLTCHYHNWSFDLASGDNLYGGDRLRVYPTRVEDGAVWIDLRDPPPAERISATLASLREAFDDHDYSRLARELARLSKLGADPLDAVRAAIAWTHDRLENGTTHAFAAAAGWLRLHAEADDDESRLICLQECLGHMAWDALRQPVFPYPAEARAYDGAQFLAALEAQDEGRAIPLLRGALAEGRGMAELERTLTRAALAHYSDFGHSLIYLVHMRALVERLGRSVEGPLLLALTRSYLRATREDLLPDFRGYADALARWPAVHRRASSAAEPLQPATIKQALARTLDHAARLEPAEVYRRLLLANARNLQRFDTRFEQLALDKPGEDVGWLDATHGITFANAVRVQCERFPEFWPQGLLQLALFAGRNARYTTAEPPPVDADALDAPALDRVLDHGIGLYIHSAHKLKTWLAARDESAAAAPDVAACLRAGVARYLSTNVKQKHTRRAARLALEFVAREE